MPSLRNHVLFPLAPGAIGLHMPSLRMVELAVPCFSLVQLQYDRTLLRLHYFVDHHLAALYRGDDLVHGGVARQRNVDHIVAGIERHIHR
jgi:hypothetical protein